MLPIGQIIKHHGFNFHCYADDIQIYFTTPSTSVLPPPTLRNCIKELKLWLEANYLRFNSDKTEVILIGSKAVASKHFSQLMDLDGDLIMPSTKVRNLGVLIDFTLSFNHHFGKVVNTAFFDLRNISHIRSSLRQQDVETVIHAFVTSQLDYCNSLLYGLSDNNIKRLQYIQNSAVRLIAHTIKNDHITSILYHLHWLPVSLRINYKILIFTYKALHNLSLTYLSDLLLPYVPARSLRSSSEGLLVTPKFLLVTMRARAFSVVAPRLWNVLPQNICQASSLLSFVNLLKTHFFLSITLESIVCELYPVMDVYLHSLCISNLIL